MQKSFLKLSAWLLSVCSPALSQVQDTPDIQVSTADNHHVENSIAINPTNPNNILISTIGRSRSGGGYHVPYFFTTDGGATWSGSEDTPNGVASNGDPVVFFDSQGDAYYVVLGVGTGSMYLMKSTNGGAVWSGSVNANPQGFLCDKPHAQADLSSTHPDNIYVVFSARFDNDRIRLSRSTNGGSSFSSTPIELENTSNTSWVSGANISIGPNGEVYVFWVKGKNPEIEIRFCKSTDGGASFSSPVKLCDISGLKTGDSGDPAFNGLRVNSFPSSGVDRTENGVRRGWVYVVYADKSSGDADIYLRRSTDNGNSWNAARLVNQTSGDGKQQWFCSLAVDQLSGALFISYYNMDATGFLTARYMAVSTDGGDTFTNVLTSESRFTPSGTDYNSIFMGDYYETAAHGYKGFACWSNNNSGKYQVYVSKVTLPVDVTIDQKISGGNTVGTVRRWVGSFTPLPSLPAFLTFDFGTIEVLQGDQTIILNEKYNRWNDDPDVLNHHEFLIDGNTNRFTSNFNPTHDATIQAQLFDDGSSGSVDFKDPWLIDFPDPNYENNLRNQGIPAPFKNVNYTISNLGTGTIYKGVFLNQDPAQTPTYYFVRALETQTINSFTCYFQNWASTNADITSPLNLNGSYYESPVVFTAANATVTARYPNMIQPTVMTEKTSNYGQPSSYIFFESTSDNSWYQITLSQSSSLIGTNIAGMLAQEQIPSADRSSIAVRTTTTPSLLRKYGGTGQLSKSEGIFVATNIRAFRHVKDGEGKERLVVFDFTGANVRVNDKLQNDTTVCAMQVLEPRSDGIIVSKADVSPTALGLDIVRDGKCIQSYTASYWQALGSTDLQDYLPGDAIRVTQENVTVGGYYEVMVVPSSSGRQTAENGPKPDSSAQRTSFVERSQSISVYPNPFNASTLFSISLPSPSHAKLVVYDLLGKEIARPLDGSLEAGVHAIRFNASRLASGAYLYRLQLDRGIHTGRLLLLK